MSAEGKVLSPSSQNMAQLKAELTARSLSTEGKRDDLKRRVMVSLVMLSSSACCFAVGQRCAPCNTVVQAAWLTI